MSDTTSNLNLIVGQTDDTKFSDYVGNLDDNFRAIDEFAGKVFGISGIVSLSTSKWTNKTYSLTVNNLGDNDAVFFSPVTLEDKQNLESAEIIISASRSIVTFTASKTPSADIRLNYFIARGI